MSSDGISGVPYQPKVFADFIALIGRYFYDDATIVLLDTLAREQRGMTELELKDLLKWRENLLHQKLYALEKQLLLERIIEQEKGTKNVFLWRIHTNVFVAVEWRYNAMMDKLTQDLKDATRQTGLMCNPCNLTVDLLAAASGPKAQEDDHPLCRQCGTRLTTSNFETAKVAASDKIRRAQAQLGRIRDSLSRVRGMNVPAFTSVKLIFTPSVHDDRDTPLQTPVQNPVTAPTQHLDRSIAWFNNASAAQPHPQPRPQTAAPLSVTSLTFGTAAAAPPRKLTPAAGLLKTGSFGSGISLVPPPSQISAANRSSTSAELKDRRSPLKLSFGGSKVGSQVGSATGQPARQFSMRMDTDKNNPHQDLPGAAKRPPPFNLAGAFDKRIKF